MRRFGIPKTGEQVRALIRRNINGVITDYPVVALEADFSPRERGDGSIIQRTDTRYLVSSVDLEITPTRRTDIFVLVIEDSAETELILASEPKRIAPAGPMSVVFWDFHCRGR